MNRATALVDRILSEIDAVLEDDEVVDGRTSCCGAFTTVGIDDGVEFCRACYRPATPGHRVPPTFRSTHGFNATVREAPSIGVRW